MAALIIVAVSGGSIALLVYLRRRQWAREAAALDRDLAIKREGLDKQRKGQSLDENLQAKSRARREIADQVKRRSALIASGSSSASVLKIARKVSNG